MLNVTGRQGSNGKSTAMDFINFTFEIYTSIIANNALTISGETKLHKTISNIKPYHRIGLVPDIKNEKINETSFKTLIGDSKISNEKMYGTVEEIALNMKLFFNSNYDFRADPSPAVARRVINVELTNVFLSVEEIEAKRREIRDPKIKFYEKTDIKDRFPLDEDLQYAFITLALEYGVKYYREGLLVPASLRNSIKEVMEENDKVKNFIDNYYISFPGGNVHKDELLKTFNVATSSNVSWPYLLGEVKRLGIEYDRMTRVRNSSKGCVIGLRYKTQTNPNIYTNNQTSTDEVVTDDEH